MQTIRIRDGARSVIESLSRTGIKRYAMKRSTLAGATSPCISSFLRIDDGRRRRAATGWKIIFRGAKTLSARWSRLTFEYPGVGVMQGATDITVTIFIKLPRIRADIFPPQLTEAANKIKWYVQCCSRYCPAVVIPATSVRIMSLRTFMEREIDFFDSRVFKIFNDILGIITEIGCKIC